MSIHYKRLRKYYFLNFFLHCLEYEITLALQSVHNSRYSASFRSYPGGLTNWQFVTHQKALRSTFHPMPWDLGSLTQIYVIPC